MHSVCVVLFTIKKFVVVFTLLCLWQQGVGGRHHGNLSPVTGEKKNRPQIFTTYFYAFIHTLHIFTNQSFLQKGIDKPPFMCYS